MFPFALAQAATDAAQSANDADRAADESLQLGRNVDPVEKLIEQLNGMYVGFLELLPRLGIALVILVLAGIVAAMLSRAFVNLASRAHLRPSLRNLVRLLAKIVIWVLAIMVAAVVIFPGLTPASMLAGLGLGSVAIGFAFKDIFENFLAGIIILLRNAMRIGDFIECDDISGQVEDISLRETHVRRTDGQLVIVPNAYLFKNPLAVVTDLKDRRVTVICGVAYGEDVDASRDVIRKAVEGCETVLRDGRPIQIFAQEFADSAINFEVTWWTGSKPVDVRRSKDEVVAAVKRALDDAGIEIPFPYRTLTFKEPLRMRSETADADEVSRIADAAE